MYILCTLKQFFVHDNTFYLLVTFFKLQNFLDLLI